MHIIRLRGPWQVEAMARFVLQPEGSYKAEHDGLPPSVRATMPADWAAVLGGDFFGRARFGRVFQKPTGLESGERVWLVVEPLRTRGVVELNRKPLGEVFWSESSARFEITELLEDHNRLEIAVEHPALDASGAADDDSDTNVPGGLVGEVRLEIEE